MADYKEFSKQIKEKYPQYKDVDDEKLARAMIKKYPRYEKKVTFDVKNEPVRPRVTINKSELDLSKDFTPSGLAKRGAQNISALIRMPMYGEDFNTAKDNARINQILFEKKHPVIMGGAEFINDLSAYSKLPLIKGQGLIKRTGAFLGNAAIQGGLPGAIETLKDNGNILQGASTGSGVAALFQGIPLIGKPIVQGAKWLGGQYAEKVARLKQKTIEQLVKPNSKALDLSADDAQSLLLNTTERVRNDYNSLLNKKGNRVGNLLRELPEDVRFKAGDIHNDYSKIYDNYSLSGKDELNPAINATKREREKIKNLLYGDGKQRYNEYSDSIKNIEFPKNYLETIKGRYKNKYHTKVLDNLNNDIVFAQRNFNNNILDKLRKNPEILKNPQEIEKLEKEVGNYARFPYDEVNQEFYNKFYDAIEKGQILQEGQNYINPKELYDINKNISENMINWDKPGETLKNNVLEQIYGANAKKISDLSPALKQANKEYSDLMDFEKNEGIRRILNNSNNIDAASSALKNYNSTITKGNTNRNIHDLEKKLVEEGYSPFINDIDDVNAAQNLLNSPETGINAKGGVDFAKLLTRPAFHAVRAANRLNLPEKINAIRPLGQALPPALSIGLNNLLYGGISNFDDDYNY